MKYSGTKTEFVVDVDPRSGAIIVLFKYSYTHSPETTLWTPPGEQVIF